MLRLKLGWVILFVVAACGRAAAATPADAPLPEGQETTIECEYSKDEPGIQGEFKITPDKGTYHYKVYVPVGYGKDPDRRYPCLFISDAGGNARMGGMAARLRRDEWIAVMLVEAKNGPWGPIIGNFLAAHDDAVTRLRIQDGMKYATGCSGGARASSLYIGLRQGFAGALLQAAGFAHTYKSVQKYKHLAIYATFGDKDMNLKENDELKRTLAGTRFRSEVFQGGHQWAPTECTDRAFDWFEEQLLFNSGMVPAPIVVNCFKLRFGQIADASGIRRYERLAWLDRLATLHRLDKQPEIKDTVKQVRDDLKTLKQDAALKHEVAAFDAYAKATEREASIRDALAQPKMRPDLRKQTFSAVVQAYAAVAGAHKDAEYGKKAAERQELLTKEMESMK
ncbi:MAG: hypothetical protein NT049_18175 [Planctomycetota bacterium]|nr:hypothetical protein [Planctomycetota bacterium]